MACQARQWGGVPPFTSLHRTPPRDAAFPPRRSPRSCRCARPSHSRTPGPGSVPASRRYAIGDGLPRPLGADQSANLALANDSFQVTDGDPVVKFFAQLFEANQGVDSRTNRQTRKARHGANRRASCGTCKRVGLKNAGRISSAARTAWRLTGSCRPPRARLAPPGNRAENPRARAEGRTRRSIGRCVFLSRSCRGWSSRDCAPS